MNKFKLFIENFLIYGLGGIICKIVPLIMVPIVTRIMPNSSVFESVICQLSFTFIKIMEAKISKIYLNIGKVKLIKPLIIIA